MYPPPMSTSNRTPRASLLAGRRTLGDAVVIALALCVIAGGPGCKQEVIYVECELGTIPVGDQCEALPPPPPPTVDANGGGSASQDGSSGGGDTASRVETNSEDSVVVPQVVVGTACVKDADCGDGICLNWAGGSCTRLDCLTQGCPAGTVCTPIKGGNTACLALCTAEEPCPQESHGCKALQSVEGEYEHVCHGVADDAGDVGSPCGGHDLCVDDTVCLTSFPGGYCSLEGCDEQSCPIGSGCFVFEGKPTCLQQCADDADCITGDNADRRCALLKNIDGVLVRACISAVGDQGMGEQCTNAFECSSGSCEVLGEGACSQTGMPCFVVEEGSADQGCEADEFCLVTGSNQVGACTQSCAIAAPCPGTSLCQGTEGEAEGLCRPPCEGPGENSGCRTDAGFICTYGFALGDSTGQGRYLCLPSAAGSLGAPCDDDHPCAVGVCESLEEGADGTCTVPCGQDLYCPFPGLCSNDAAFGICRTACLSDADCWPGASCTSGLSPLGKVCL